LCSAEKNWTRSTGSDQKKCIETFKQARMTFDKSVQRTKRAYLRKVQLELSTAEKEDGNFFWKTIGKLGIGSERGKAIPMEVKLADGTISTSRTDVLNKWQQDFEDLLNNDSDPSEHVIQDIDDVTSPMNEVITHQEIMVALKRMKNKKAVGEDGLPVEVIRNPNVLFYFYKLINQIFTSFKVPVLWTKGIIQPIPKSSTCDKRDPMAYRGITISSSVYKLYCSVLNERLSTWAEESNLLVDEQNGFRKGRSTIDHLSSLTNIIDTRKKKRKATFCAFIDFKKAYDSIDRSILWSRLEDIGIRGRMLKALTSIYKNVSCCVRVNGWKTDWFSVNCGVKQGCLLSPLLFNLFINDLALTLKGLGVGVHIDDDVIPLLMYADDIVLLAESESDLQLLLDCTGAWCERNKLQINQTKSKIIHFRNPSVPISQRTFTCGNVELEITDRYRYLGLVLDEHLNYNSTAKVVAQSATRALGLVIAKSKQSGGMEYNVFKKLYDNLVQPIITYGAAIWGLQDYSCIKAVQHRAGRFYLGVGKYTPTDAVLGELGWKPISIIQREAALRQWKRFVTMSNSRLNRKLFLWAEKHSTTRCKNWNFKVHKLFIDMNCENLCSIDYFLPRTIDIISSCLFDRFKEEWSHRILNNTGKLRNYRLYKDVYRLEHYAETRMPGQHRSAYAKFRCGVAPIRIETGRYENIPAEDRLCNVCKNNVIEDEPHVILNCPFYDDLRYELLHEAQSKYSRFNQLPDEEQFSMLLCDVNLSKVCAKTCFTILKRRRWLLYH